MVIWYAGFCRLTPGDDPKLAGESNPPPEPGAVQSPWRRAVHRLAEASAHPRRRPRQLRDAQRL